MPQQGKPGPGDFTGRMKAQNAHDQRELLAEREAEITTLNNVRTREETRGVFDPQTGATIDAEDDGPRLIEEDEHPQRRRFFGSTDEPVLTGKETDEEVAPVVAARRAFSMPPEFVKKSKVVIRVDSDIPKMTYGMTENGEPNNFDFKEGLKYEVSVDIAEHLNNLGYVRQFLDA